MKQLSRYLVQFTGSLLLVLVATVIISAGKAFAAERVWTGAGGNNNLATAGNWQGGVAPVDGDSLSFPNLMNALTVNNNLSSDVTITGITSSTVSNASISVTGSTLNLSGSINSGNQTRIKFTGPISINNTVNVIGAGGVDFEGSISGSGNLNITGDGLYSGIYADNSSYSGAISITDGASLWVDNEAGLGSPSVGTTVSGGSHLLFKMENSATVSEPLILSSPSLASPVVGACTDLVYYCGRVEGRTLTLTGNITLNSNVSFIPSNDMVVTQAPIGGHSISRHVDSEGTLTVAGEAVAGSESLEITVTESNQCPGHISQRMTYIINIDCSGVSGRLSIYGTLMGTGTVGETTIYGIIAPGNSPGTLSTGDLNFGEGGIYEFELAGNGAGEYDQINVTGTVSFGTTENRAVGALRVLPLNNFTPSQGQQYTIISNDGEDAVEGAFAGLAEGASVEVNGTAWFTISYVGGDGNDVVLTAIPGVGDAGNETQTSMLPVLVVSSAAVIGLGFAAKRRVLGRR